MGLAVFSAGRRRRQASLASALVLALCGCGGDSGPTESAIRPDTVVGAVNVSPDAVMLMMGETRQLTATVENVLGDTLVDRPVAWSSTNPSVVAVDSTGLVTGLDPGRAAIVATTGTQSSKATVEKTPRFERHLTRSINDVAHQLGRMVDNIDQTIAAASRAIDLGERILGQSRHSDERPN